MRKGHLTREQAIERVGLASIQQVDALDCQFSQGLLDDVTDVEFYASLETDDLQGEPVIVTVYYYQDREAVESAEELDHLDWQSAGYEIEENN